MCTLAVYWHVAERLPLLVAANRDEFLSRPTLAPQVVAAAPWVVAGQDLVAGGTWLGVNEHRMIVGLLNRPQAGGHDPSLRSRGVLCLEALHLAHPRAVLEHLQAQAPQSYNGFNLLVAAESESYVATNHGGRLSVTALEPGVHVLTNADVNDPTCPRIAKSHQLFQEVSLPNDAASLRALPERMRAILADHHVPVDPRGPSAANTLCVHRGEYGTRSSTVIAVPEHGQPMHYWHAAGPPCRSPYEEVPLPA